jgi:hypothetical protein
VGGEGDLMFRDHYVRIPNCHRKSRTGLELERNQREREMSKSSLPWIMKFTSLINLSDRWSSLIFLPRRTRASAKCISSWAKEFARGGEEGGGEREGRGAKEGIDTGHVGQKSQSPVPFQQRHQKCHSGILISSFCWERGRREIEDEEIRVNYSCGESKHTIVEASCCDRGRIVERGNAQRLNNNNKGIFAKLAISIFGLCWNMVTHTLRDQSTEWYIERGKRERREREDTGNGLYQ